MLTGSIWLLIWSAIAFAAAIGMLIGSVILLKHARKYKKQQEELLKKVEKRTQEKYNRIALMEPKDLITYLTSIFAKMVEVEAQTRVSEKDHNSSEKLYGYALAATLEYLGPETIAAIDYYYGKNFVERWSYSSYQLATIRGLVQPIIDKNSSFEIMTGSMM